MIQIWHLWKHDRDRNGNLKNNLVLVNRTIDLTTTVLWFSDTIMKKKKKSQKSLSHSPSPDGKACHLNQWRNRPQKQSRIQTKIYITQGQRNDTSINYAALDIIHNLAFCIHHIWHHFVINIVGGRDTQQQSVFPLVKTNRRLCILTGWTGCRSFLSFIFFLQKYPHFILVTLTWFITRASWNYYL